MKRDIAKRFLEEYEHWANGGDVLYKLECDDNWYTAGEEFEPDTNHAIEALVINDKNVELRKAYALGKQIQFLSQIHGKWVDVNKKPWWCDDYKYRVKPKAWYEDERNVGKIILVNDIGDRSEGKLRLFKSYNKDATYPFTTDDETAWKYAWLVNPDELAKEEIA